MTSSIDIETYRKEAASSSPPILLDVRRKADYEQAPQMLPGATWRNPQKIDTWIQSLPQDSAVVTYCVKGGPVSQSTVDRLRMEGFSASFLEGGIKAWVAGGNPVESIRTARP